MSGVDVLLSPLTAVRAAVADVWRSLSLRVGALWGRRVAGLSRIASGSAMFVLGLVPAVATFAEPDRFGAPVWQEVLKLSTLGWWTVMFAVAGALGVATVVFGRMLLFVLQIIAHLFAYGWLARAAMTTRVDDNSTSLVALCLFGWVFVSLALIAAWELHREGT